MGLDIYAYRVKKQVMDKHDLNHLSSPKEIYNAFQEEEKKEFREKMLKCVAKIGNNFDEGYQFLLSTLKALPFFDTYDWHYKDFVKQTQGKTLDEIISVVNRFIDVYYSLSNMYFRKVNFLYAHFSDVMEDEMCVVNKSHLVNLREICQKVLDNKDKKFSEEHLPTQCGFFFGSTEYDKYYYEDVLDCIQQLDIFLKDLTDEDIVFWRFSW